MRRGFGAWVVAVLLVPALLWAADTEKQLWHYRNLGKAFYENPATQYEAVGAFQKAMELAPGSVQDRVNYGLALMRAGKTAEGIVELQKAQAQDPSIPHTWFSLGIAYKRASQYDLAIEQLEGMVRLVPDEPITHYNLGILYKINKQHERALRHLEKAAALAPNLAGPYFQLATAYRQAKRMEDAKTAMANFRRIKKQQAGAAIPEDLEWSYYAEIYETMDPKHAQSAAAQATLRLEARQLQGEQGGGATGLMVLDADGDLKPDLLAWSGGGVSLFQNGATAVPSGLEALRNVTAAAAGDIDNDGLVDLCVLTPERADLYVNRGGRFEKRDVALPPGHYRQAVWLDFDHDYDLDLFLLGASSALLRNNGEAGFSDMTRAFPFVKGSAVDGVMLDGVADTQGMDLAVIYADRPGVLYRDRLGGTYEAVPLTTAPGEGHLGALDFNHDGWTDLVAAHGERMVLWVNDQRGGFKAVTAPEGARAPFVFADLEARSVSELIAGGRVFRNRGLGIFEPAAVIDGLNAAAALVAADFDIDGRLDMAAIDAKGAVQVWRNVTESANHWLRVGLQGVKNLKLAPGAEVEVKTGPRYQKQLYHNVPLTFGIGTDTHVDVVRITWPNGMIQNETQQAANQAPVYKEAQRLSGSCPMIFTWNGQRFEFITDVLGVAPLGASAGDGAYFPVDHDEYIQIAGTSLTPANGAYEIRIAEELREVAYLDELQLIAVDHPKDVEIFTNDKFKGPPYPAFRLFGVRQRLYPKSARDDRGRDVRERLMQRDQIYPNGFERNYAGVAELHHLDLDFGPVAPDNRAVLVLSGWVDWADGSTFLSMSQASPSGLILPYLQVKNAQGEWVTVIEDMGLPAGKPKTIVVDLSHAFLSDARQIRIVTNLCVYWDEIFMSAESGAPPVHLTPSYAASAQLHFRGFSEVVIHPQRQQPERFIYDRIRPQHLWNWSQTPGLYTRYGDVKPLVRAVDDRMVIMGSGDELALKFDASRLPALAAGWQRDFLLKVDGWAKDADANTAFSQTVEPLPYHDMPQYPYPVSHTYPQDGEHQRYREFYNTRPALRLIRPLRREMDKSMAAFAPYVRNP
jgi:Tfp pilus assembly protein PilF